MDNLLTELKPIIEALDAPVMTGFFRPDKPDGTPPALYVVMLPVGETFQVFGDNEPFAEIQEVSLIIFSRHDSSEFRRKLAYKILTGGFTISDRRFAGYDYNTEHYQYIMDVRKSYPICEVLYNGES